MNCHTIRALLPLHAGGDLKPGKARYVEQHIADCSSCRTELAELKASRDMIRHIASADIPSLPGDFTDSVLAEVAETFRKPPWYRNTYTWARLAVAACVVALFGILWHTIIRDIGLFREQRLAVQREQVQALINREPSLVTADRLAGLSIRGPFRLDEWEPSGDAGLFAIMHKPDPESRPEVFSIDYLGEAKRIEYRGDPWRRQRINRLSGRAGSPDNIYIAEYPMPYRSVSERRAALNTLIGSLQPYYN